MRGSIGNRQRLFTEMSSSEEFSDGSEEDEIEIIDDNDDSDSDSGADSCSTLRLAPREAMRLRNLWRERAAEKNMTTVRHSSLTLQRPGHGLQVAGSEGFIFSPEASASLLSNDMLAVMEKGPAVGACHHRSAY